MTRNGSARNIYLSDATWNKAKEDAKKKGISPSKHIDELINKYKEEK